MMDFALSNESDYYGYDSYLDHSDEDNYADTDKKDVKTNVTSFDPWSPSNDYKYLFNGSTNQFYVNDALDTNCSEIVNFLAEINSYSTPSQIVVPVVYCVICLIGLIGNGLVMFVIFGSKEMYKTVSNIYIWNLAVADTLLLISLPFSSTQRILLSWPFGAGMCKILEAVKYLNYFASIFFLTAMSIDRYVAVVYVVKSGNWRTSRNTFFICASIWITSLIMVVPLLVYTRLHGEICALVFNFQTSENVSNYPTVDEYPMEYYEDFASMPPCDKMAFLDYPNIGSSFGQTTGVSGDWDLDNVDDYEDTKNKTGSMEHYCKHPNSKTFHAYLIFTFAVGFVIPFGIITVCYIMIIIRLLRPLETRTKSKQAERTRRKVTRMVVALVATFFVSWLPFHVWHLIQIVGIKATVGICHNVRDFTFCLGYANSCLNPILYTFLGHNFQERLRKSIAISLRSFSFTTFTKYTTNTMSRAETGALSKKMESQSDFNEAHVQIKLAQPLSQGMEYNHYASPHPSLSVNEPDESTEQTKLNPPLCQMKEEKE